MYVATLSATCDTVYTVDGSHIVVTVFFGRFQAYRWVVPDEQADEFLRNEKVATEEFVAAQLGRVFGAHPS